MYNGQSAYREQRLARMRALRESGRDPYGAAFARSGRLAEVRAAFEEGGDVRIAGRLAAVRDMGKSVFADLADATGKFQVYAQKNVLGEEAFAAFKLLDPGDIIGVRGSLFTTRQGEPTVKAASWMMLSKSLRPPP